MGTLVVSDLIGNYRRILIDPAPGVTWIDATFLILVQQAERAICSLKPEALTTLGPITLVAGVHQDLPAGSTAILDLYENSTPPSRRVTQVSRSLHDSANRFWPSATQEAAVQEWTADPRDPLRFDVSPPNDGTGSVNGLYGIVPPAIVTIGGAINLVDTYEMVIQSFVLAKAYAENTTRQDLTKSGLYENDWKSMLGIRTQSQIAVAQKSSSPGGT